MKKFWQLLLTNILITTSIIGTIKIIETIETINSSKYSEPYQKPFYKKVDQAFSDSSSFFEKKDVFVNTGGRKTKDGIIFYWKDYADSWDEFKNNYNDLNLKVDLAIYFWEELGWSNDGFSIALKDITSKNDNWIELNRIKRETRQPSHWDNTWGKISYAVWLNGSAIKISFYVDSWASNDWEHYYFTTIPKHVTSSPTSDLIGQVESRFNNKVNNKTLSLKSDYSTSLQDKNNIPTEKDALDELIEDALDEYYQTWKSFIKDYAYDDKTNQVTITVKFKHPDTNKSMTWNFKVKIEFKLTQDYWDKQFQDRLTVMPGKIIDVKNPNGAMIEDKPLEWQDKHVYSTTATIRFAGALDGSETMKVNGQYIDVIDNNFTFVMTDNQENKTNEYEILLEKHDLNDFNTILGSYTFKYLIKQNISNLNLKWYAWNPNNNPDHNKLINPTLPNGEVNPNYDKEVNPKTGTKTEIMWVKQKAQNPFPLDPLNKNGDVIIDNNYDEGFLAEGSVSGMGIVQDFNDSWIKSVKRVKVDSKTLKPIESFKEITADSDGRYWSESGTYLYIVTDQKNLTFNKFIIIGQEWQERYVKFLDVLNNYSIVVPFWSTLQGFHLKNYLAKYKQLNSKEIQNLIFEQVSSYWKEYVSDVKSQHIGPQPDPDDNFNLKDINFETIKMNKDNISEIREEIILEIKEQLSKTELIYDIDYELKPFDDNNLKKLLNYDSKGNATITLNIIALNTSTKAIGSNKIKISNNIHYDPDKVIDLKNIHFKTQRFNFSEFTVNQLENWIFKDINQTFENYQISLDYPDDYGVKPIDEKSLKQFLTSKTYVSLIITIYSQDDSMKTKNSTTLELINDPDASIVPPDPDPGPDPNPDPNPDPGPDPNPDPNPDPKPIPPDNSWISKKINLIIMSVIAILIVSISGTIIFLKYRLKKGIGGKKTRKQKTIKRI